MKKTLDKWKQSMYIFDQLVSKWPKYSSKNNRIVTGQISKKIVYEFRKHGNCPLGGHER